MIVVGLTGSIAMGKSETARLFRAQGIPVFDADACVDKLYAKDGVATREIASLLPSAINEGAVDRMLLSKILLAQPELLGKIENIVHPLVKQQQQEFLDHHGKKGTEIVILDIPLLLEQGRQAEVDKVIVVSAPATVQQQRAMARPGMTKEKLEMIRSRQMPDARKRTYADFILDTSHGIDVTRQDVKNILNQLRGTQETEHA